METHPEEVEEVTAELKDKPHLLQSLAKKVEGETGRGELKVSFFLCSTEFPAGILPHVT